LSEAKCGAALPPVQSRISLPLNPGYETVTGHGYRMGKRKQSTPNLERASPAPAPKKSAADPLPDDQISYSSLSLHDLFEQQTRQMLDRTDLDEEQKQNILVAMSCPCCGAGAMSYTVKLKR
jgi:hypothetical protein